ncbi:hypothetical protein HY993_03265 [Candidatus Micrarchaeota archaeon]|nr:hypothetical protein [Candidatus Micrarchaeota archaeon]
MGDAPLEERISQVLAREYDYVPGTVRQLANFIKTLHEFCNYLGNNKYYSDSVNKKVFLLNLDSSTLSMKVEKLRLTAELFYNQVEKSVLAKKKAGLDKKAVAAFREDVSSLQKEADGLYEESVKIVAQIRKEFTERNEAKQQ